MLSLRLRLALLVGSLFIMGTVVLYVASNLYGRTAADRSYDRLLAASALSIAETISVSAESIAVDVPYAALDMLGAAPDDRVFYRVIGPFGNTVTGYDDLPQRPDGLLDGAGTAGAFSYFDAPYKGEVVRFARTAREIVQPGVSGSIVVQVGHTRRAREALVRELVISAIMPIALVTVFALAMVWLVIDRALLPLDRLRRDIAARRPSDLQPLTAPVPIEIKPMVAALNDFMRRLDATIDTLRAFIADAAHQIRTPLAALRAQVQAATDDDPEEIRRSLSAVERSAATLSRLVNQLLSDAAVIHRSQVMRFEMIDLHKVIAEAVKESASISDYDLIRVACKPGVAPLHGDALMLREALKNLIDNALQHGEGKELGVDVQLCERGEDYVLTVSDRGPAIPPALKDRLFERFARRDERTRGAGLGLAIVKQAVEAHGGGVQLLDRDGTGLTVELRLPRRVQ